MSKCPIGSTMLQVDDYGSVGVRYLLGAHDGITARDRYGCGGSGSINRRETL